MMLYDLRAAVQIVLEIYNLHIGVSMAAFSFGSGGMMRALIVILPIVMSLGLSFRCLAETTSVAPSNLASSSRIITQQSPLVVGNGYGFAVLSPQGHITKLYAHPYRFERPNPDESKDGYETTNFVKSLKWDWFTPVEVNSKGIVYAPARSTKPEISYVGESHVLKVKDGDLEQHYFMPFGLQRNVLIATHNAAGKPFLPCLVPNWQHPVKANELKTIAGKQVRLVTFKDTKESVAIVPLEATPFSKAFSGSRLIGNNWAFISLPQAEELSVAVTEFLKWHKMQDSDHIMAEEFSELEKWRVVPKVSFKSEEEKRLWRQNETFLRMSQIQEPNNEKRTGRGLILASLPDGVWFTPWVRDMAYAVVGLIKMGHLEEAKRGLLAWFNAHPVGKWKRETRNLDYQISVTRYFGDGSEEADYSGLKTPNVEFDDWGLALWAVSEYFDKTKDLDFLNTKTYRGCTVYESMKDFIVSPLFGNLDKFEDGLIVTADSSLWEEHQENKKHFAFSTFSNIKGLRGFLKIAEAMKDKDEVKLVSGKLDLIEKGFQKAFVHDGVVWGVAVEPCPKSEIDGSLLEAFNMGIVTDSSVLDKTLEKMELLKTASGGYRRLLGPSDYEKQEFVFIDFHMARVLLSIGKKDEAQRIIDRIVEKSLQDHGLIAECYVSEKSKDFKGEIGDPTGSIPMIGYGSGIYAMTLVERENAGK